MDEVDEPKKLSTGIAELDEILSGSERQDLHLFVGSPAERAPCWSQLLGRVSERDGKKTLVVDLEMDDPPDKRITP
jgi:hypothetical protein